MNKFVEYLNSINNSSGDSTGSLAEKQVTSPFFDMVKVDRKIGIHIADHVLSKKHKAFILTGHAGDGKTSILVQVLKNLNLLEPGEQLNVQCEYDDFFYVKDMSEIPEDMQGEVLERAIKAPDNGKTSLLISNTGPLLKAAEYLEKKHHDMLGKLFTDESRTDLQTRVLTQLDTNSAQDIKIADCSVVLVNIARVDNVHFSPLLLGKLLEESLWSDCSACVKTANCPIRNNRDCVSKYFKRVSSFVEHFNRYLYENDRRMTIRQIVGQISYALTGNLTCDDIIRTSLKYPLFNYNFANLFFGYRGLNEAKECSQINGVKQLRILNLDSMALDVDYDLFVRQDYTCFPLEIRTELQYLQKRSRSLYYAQDEDNTSFKNNQKDRKLRKSIRRFYLVFSNYSDDDELLGVFNQIYGSNYSDYWKLISKTQTRPMLRKMKELIFKALYIKNTGFLPGEQSILYLSLRREGDVFQNVMLVLGKVNRDDLEVIQIPVANEVEDLSCKQQVALKLKNAEFPISLPMITYFSELTSGAISSNNNPALTHGIAKLDALLIEQFGYEHPKSKEDCELTVLVNTPSGQEIKRFGFEDNRLSIL